MTITKNNYGFYKLNKYKIIESPETVLVGIKILEPYNKLSSIKLVSPFNRVTHFVKSYLSSLALLRLIRIRKSVLHLTA